MQTKSVSLHFMVFIKGPRKGSRGKKKKEKNKRTETTGIKTSTKNFTAELRKFAEVMKNSQRTHIANPCSFPFINLIHVSHNYSKVITGCVHTLHKVILPTFLISKPVRQNHKNIS